MKIDLYNNYETFRAESKQDTAINQWYRDVGLTAKDIEHHPCITDLSILINIRNNFWHLMTKSEQNVWCGSWGNVYKYCRFIRPKTMKKLEVMMTYMNSREKRKHEQREKIQSQRQANTEPIKRDHNSEAKGSHSHSLHKQTVANESAGECPYF